MNAALTPTCLLDSGGSATKAATYCCKPSASGSGRLAQLLASVRGIREGRVAISVETPPQRRSSALPTKIHRSDNLSDRLSTFLPGCETTSASLPLSHATYIDTHKRDGTKITMRSPISQLESLLHLCPSIYILYIYPQPPLTHPTPPPLGSPVDARSIKTSCTSIRTVPT